MTIRGLPADLQRQITLLSCAAFASTGSVRIADPLLPQLAAEFHLPLTQAAWTVSGFALAYGLALFVIGPLGDRYGKYRVINFAVLASLIGGLLAVLAPSFGWLVAGRILTGLTAAASIPLAMAWIGDKVPYAQRQPVLAFFLTGQLVGMIGGQFCGGLLADFTGWRGAFWFMLLTYAVVGTLLLIERRRSPDLDATTHAEAEAVTGSQWSRFKAVVSGRWPRIVLLCVNGEGVFVFGGLAMMPSYLHHQFDISLTLAGACVALFGVGGFGYTLFARRLLGWLGEAGLAIGGGIILCAAFVLLAFAPHWVWSAPAACGVGLGYYMLHNTLQTNATQMAPAQRGTAVGLFASCLFAGQTIGVWLASTVADRFGFIYVFLLAALCLPLVGGGFAAMLRHKPATPHL